MSTEFGLLGVVAAHEKLGYKNEIIHKLLKFESLMKTGTARFFEEKINKKHARGNSKSGLSLQTSDKKSLKSHKSMLQISATYLIQSVDQILFKR